MAIPPRDQTYGAPRVSNPLDASKFLTQPCAVLSQTQLAHFDIRRPGEPDTESAVAREAGPRCVWYTEGGIFGMGFLTGNKNGLSDTYRGRSRFNFWEETTVEGYPAVFNDPSDGRPAGACNLTVGISDTLTFRALDNSGRTGQAACDRTKEYAAAIIQTLKASS